MSTETTRLRMRSSHRAPSGVKKEGLKDIPNEIVIYEILSNIIYETKGDSELKLNDLFGYFINEGKYRKVYQVWGNIVIKKIIGGVHECVKIRKIPQLERLTSLSLSCCEKIEAIPQLERLTSLSLWLCDKIEAIPQLERLTSLTLKYCNKIEEIPQLERLTSLTVEDCDYLVNIKEKTQEKIHVWAQAQQPLAPAGQNYLSKYN